MTTLREIHVELGKNHAPPCAKTLATELFKKPAKMTATQAQSQTDAAALLSLRLAVCEHGELRLVDIDYEAKQEQKHSGPRTRSGQRRPKKCLTREIDAALQAADD